MALALSRKVGESLVIDENVVVTVVRITPGNVRLAIQAPKRVPIRRSELPAPPAPPASACTCRIEARDGDTALRECEACRRKREDE